MPKLFKKKITENKSVESTGLQDDFKGYYTDLYNQSSINGVDNLIKGIQELSTVNEKDVTFDVAENTVTITITYRHIQLKFPNRFLSKEKETKFKNHLTKAKKLVEWITDLQKKEWFRLQLAIMAGTFLAKPATEKPEENQTAHDILKNKKASNDKTKAEEKTTMGDDQKADIEQVLRNPILILLYKCDEKEPDVLELQRKLASKLIQLAESKLAQSRIFKKIKIPTNFGEWLIEQSNLLFGFVDTELDFSLSRARHQQALQKPVVQINLTDLEKLFTSVNLLFYFGIGILGIAVFVLMIFAICSLQLGAAVELATGFAEVAKAGGLGGGRTKKKDATP